MNLELIVKDILKISTNDDIAIKYGKDIQGRIAQIFPDSYVYVGKSSLGGGASLIYKVLLGKDRSEWTNGIPENDPLSAVIWTHDITNDDGTLKDKITAESTQYSVLTKPEDAYNAFGSLKIPFRKKTSTPEVIADYIVDYFKKVKQVLKSNLDKFPDEYVELIKRKTSNLKGDNMSNLKILAKNLRKIAERLEQNKRLTIVSKEEEQGEDLELNELIQVFRQKITKVKNVPALGKLKVLLSPENFRVRTTADQANLILNAPEEKIDVTDFITNLKKIRAKKNMPGIKALDAMLNWAVTQSPSEIKITLKNLAKIKNVLNAAKEAEKEKKKNKRVESVDVDDDKAEADKLADEEWEAARLADEPRYENSKWKLTTF